MSKEAKVKLCNKGTKELGRKYLKSSKKAGKNV